MLKQDLVNRLNVRFKELLLSYGITTPIEIRNFMDDVAVFEVPKEIANTKATEILDIYRELCASVKGAKIDPASAEDYPQTPLRGTETWEFSIYAKKGYFTISEADDEFYEKNFSDEALEADIAKKEAERNKYWRDYIIPIPPAKKNAKDELYLPMAYEPYDLIKSGEKTTEFRRYTQSYVKRILSHPIKTVRFQRGYGGPGRESPEQMVWTVGKISLYDQISRREMDPWNLPKKDGFVPTFIAIDLTKRIA